ncbi:MAG: hypothetical protein RIM84_04115 [Alphaproteobacteria bacterium]
MDRDRLNRPTNAYEQGARVSNFPASGFGLVGLTVFAILVVGIAVLFIF